jgi:hypothetical protein
VLSRSSGRNERFSNRQAAAFLILVVLGVVAGWFLGSITGGMMLGAIAGSCSIMLPGIRPRPEAPASSSADSPPHDA